MYIAIHSIFFVHLRRCRDCIVWASSSSGTHTPSKKHLFVLSCDAFYILFVSPAQRLSAYSHLVTLNSTAARHHSLNAIPYRPFSRPLCCLGYYFLEDVVSSRSSMRGP